MFDYFISLGSHCPIAASMAKYGMRAFSAPFDWLITADFKWVIHYMETDFKDFLLRKNLKHYDEYAEHFCDIQSDIRFLHEGVNIEYEYEKVKEKYDRRIKRFLEKTKSKVCYLRSIRTEEDCEYIIQNADYIRRVIKKNNPYSEIVFLCNNDVVDSGDFPFRYFNMPRAWRLESQISLRTYFDHADEFLSFCGENYSGANIMKNLSADFQKDYATLTERRYKTLTTLLTHDFKGAMASDKTIIYGAGMIGKELYKKIRDYTSVLCFLEKSEKEKEFEGVPILQVANVKPEDGIKVIVSAAYDFVNIKKELESKFRSEDIISIDEILNLSF